MVENSLELFSQRGLNIMSDIQSACVQVVQ